MWYLFDQTPSGWCKTDAHSMKFSPRIQTNACVYFKIPFVIKLATGLNVFHHDPSPHGRILLLVSLLNSFHREGLRNSATMSRCSKNIIENLSQKHGLVSRTYFKKSLIIASIFGSKSKSFMSMSLPPQDEPLTNWSVSNLEGLVSNFMASQDARLSKFETDFKQQQSEMTNKIDIVFKAITDRIARALPSNTGDSKPFDTLANLGSCVNIIPLYLFKKINIILLEETDHIFGLANETKSYPMGIVKDIEVHIAKLKWLNDFYVIDMKKDPETPLLVGRGFLATANAVIDCRIGKIVVGEGITRSVFRVKGVDLGEEEAPYWTMLGKKESYKP
nr:hypothetical protein [Tanacetum cinerariifolium]